MSVESLRPGSSMTFFCVLTWRRGRECSGVSSVKTLTTWSLPKGSPPRTITLGIGFHLYEFGVGGTQTFRL